MIELKNNKNINRMRFEDVRTEDIKKIELRKNEKEALKELKEKILERFPDAIPFHWNIDREGIAI